MNKVLFLGRLTANPEYKINEKGLKIANFRLAINSIKNNNTIFINITAFEYLADQSFKYLQKGSQIFLDGRLDCRRNIETKQEYFSIIADNITFLKNLKTVESETQVNNVKEETEKKLEK